MSIQTRIALTDEQEKIAETWGRGLAVSAGAGAGKTTTIVEKCVRLLARNPAAKLDAVSFTEKSAAELRERLTILLPGGLRGHWVTTIHGLCGMILRDCPRAGGFEGEEQMLSPPEQEALWQRAIESLWYSELEGEVGDSLSRLLVRETRQSLVALLARVRDLELSGVLGLLGSDADSQALAQLSRFVLDRYERFKRRRGGMDFSDLERGADRALEDPTIRESYHRRFELVLVDEFQDTNPVQAKILERFARPDFSNLCVVGDPKQSIYRFRDADVTVFEAFCKRMPERLMLTQNRRSRPGVLEYVNRVCLPVFEASGMEYVPLQSVREADPERAPVERLEVESPEQLADWVCAERDAGVGLEKMVLLMRRIRGNEKWLRALASRGVPLAVASGGFFYGDPRVREVVALLRWWEQPLHRKSAAVFFRAPWVGVDEKLLDEWFRTDGSLWEKFAASGHALAQVLAPFRERAVRPAELLQAVLGSDTSGALEGELDAAWLGLWHRCEELSRQGASFHEAVLDLSHACEEDRRERDVPPPANRGQLRVLTVHGAKGLEFDHVILVDFENAARRRSNAPLLYWNREQGAFLAGRDEEGNRLKKDEQENAWRGLEDQQALAESKRVFYVALTRARERLMLIVAKDLPASDELVKKSAKEEISALAKDHWKGWVDTVGDEGVVVASLAAVQDVRMLAPTERAQAVLPVVRFEKEQVYRPRHSVTEWNRLGSCPRSYEYKYVRSPGPLLDEKEVAWIEPSVKTEASKDPRELGTRVHAALEACDLDALAELESEWGSTHFKALPVQEWARKNLLGAGERDEWNELAFEVPIEGGETLVGSLDRLVRDAEGNYRILDYKVLQKFKSEEKLLDRYRAQLWIYAWAIGRLEPEALGRVSAALLAISPQGVSEVEVAIPAPSELGLWIQDRHEAARAIVAGRPGLPWPAAEKCGTCEFLSICSEGRAVLEEPRRSIPSGETPWQGELGL